jgi:hypothetical protein
MKMASHHPGSVTLKWYENAPKDSEHYGTLSSLAACLKEQGIENIQFLRRLGAQYVFSKLYAFYCRSLFFPR